MVSLLSGSCRKVTDGHRSTVALCALSSTIGEMIGAADGIGAAGEVSESGAACADIDRPALAVTMAIAIAHVFIEASLGIAETTLLARNVLNATGKFELPKLINMKTNMRANIHPMT